MNKDATMVASLGKDNAAVIPLQSTRVNYDKLHATKIN
jgi:hypothetical protein